MKRIGLFVASYVVALLLLGGLLTVVKKAEVREYALPSSATMFPEKIAKHDTLKETNATLECMNKGSGLEMNIEKDLACLKLTTNQVTESQMPKTKSQNYEMGTPPMFIVMIYALIALTFALIVDVTVFGSKYSSGISIWAIQLPPMFGVAGTMYALAMFASASSSENVLQMFRSNVADAVVTTLYGIFVYAMNLAVVSFKKE